jgi:hypothetical protein
MNYNNKIQISSNIFPLSTFGNNNILNGNFNNNKFISHHMKTIYNQNNIMRKK